MGREKKENKCCQWSAACRATLRDQSVYTCLAASESGPRAKPLSKHLLYNLTLKHTRTYERSRTSPLSLSDWHAKKTTANTEHSAPISYIWTRAYKHKIDVREGSCFKPSKSSWHFVSGTAWSFLVFFFAPLFCTALTFYWNHQWASVSAKNISAASWNV